jgi:hypothetical protein
MTLTESAIQVATGEIGVREEPLGSNWGKKVSEYIRAGGYNEPVYWCLCFQYWVVEQAAHKLGVKNPLPRTGSCDLLFAWAKKGGHLRSVPEPGDLFLVMASANDAIHTGLVIGVSGDGTTVDTIEGNSNDDGSSNGIAVVKRKRKTAKLKFVRWTSATSGYTLFIGGREVAKMPLIEGTSFAPAKAVAKALGFSPDLVTWDAEVQGIRFDKDLIQGEARIINGSGHVPIRALAGFFGLQVNVNEANHRVDLVR